MPFENIVGKGENAGNYHFLLFLQSFLPIQKKRVPVSSYILLSANSFNLDQSENLSFGKELNRKWIKFVFCPVNYMFYLILT